MHQFFCPENFQSLQIVTLRIQTPFKKNINHLHLQGNDSRKSPEKSESILPQTCAFRKSQGQHSHILLVMALFVSQIILVLKYYFNFSAYIGGKQFIKCESLFMNSFFKGPFIYPLTRTPDVILGEQPQRAREGPPSERGVAAESKEDP